MDEPKATAGSVPVDAEQPKAEKAQDVLVSPMETLESTLAQFEAMCMNGVGSQFRKRVRSRIGPRLHTMLARLGSIR
jgi:hypothetical protein